MLYAIFLHDLITMRRCNINIRRDLLPSLQYNTVINSHFVFN